MYLPIRSFAYLHLPISFLYLWTLLQSMKRHIILIILLQSTSFFSQEKKVETPFAAVDSLYREDQFYLGLTYNSLIKTPKNVTQNGLSLGISAGFLRDFPVNKSRTAAIAVGFGATYNQYNHNILVSNQNNIITYQLIDNQVFDQNKLEQITIDVPFEFRWRMSTPERHQFFRLYTGFKVGYVVLSKTKFVDGKSNQNIQNNADFNTFQYGPTLSVGYNTWNFHAYYGLNPIFKNAVLDGQKIQMLNLNLGLIFYIL